MCVESTNHSRYSRTLLMYLAIKSAHYDWAAKCATHNLFGVKHAYSTGVLIDVRTRVKRLGSPQVMIYWIGQKKLTHSIMDPICRILHLVKTLYSVTIKSLLWYINNKIWLDFVLSRFFSFTICESRNWSLKAGCEVPHMK